MPLRSWLRRLFPAGLLVLLIGTATARAEDRPQWGQRHSRNMISSETGLPDRFDPETGENVKWSAALGTQCYSTPVVAGGKVLIGTNNQHPRDPRHQGDRGVMMCFNVHRYIRNRRESPSSIKSMPVYHDGRVYVTVGGDIWWGKREAWLKCIDATGSGDATRSGLLWSCPLERHCCSTPAVYDGLVYAADCGGKIHCVDAKTGRPCWVHDAGSEMWASTLVADGKVYVGTRRGDFWVLAAGREKRVLSSIRLDDAVISTPVAANGTLYVGTMSRLYALQKPAAGR